MIATLSYLSQTYKMAHFSSINIPVLIVFLIRYGFPWHLVNHEEITLSCAGQGNALVHGREFNGRLNGRSSNYHIGSQGSHTV